MTMGSDARFPALGRTQRTVITGLFDHGYWSHGCGWSAGSPNTTVRALMGLENKGLVQHKVDRYWLTPAGWSWLMANTARTLALLEYGETFQGVVIRLAHMATVANLTSTYGKPVDRNGVTVP
jgi:hypothetical protein